MGGRDAEKTNGKRPLVGADVSCNAETVPPQPVHDLEDCSLCETMEADPARSNKVGVRTEN